MLYLHENAEVNDILIFKPSEANKDLLNWFKAKINAGAPPNPAKNTPPPEGRKFIIGVASKTLAHILQETGKHTVGIDPIDAGVHREQFRLWSEHVLEGKHVPGFTDPNENKRNWKALREFYSRHREQECREVSKNFLDLRQLLWTFVKAASQGLGATRGSDTQILRQLARLKTALEGNSIDSIKKESLPAIDMITHIVQEREDQQNRHLRTLGEKLRELRGELDKARKQLEVDALTHLYNRGAFDEQILRIADLALFSGRQTSLMMVDIDHFKKINDTYGHQGGDCVLKSIADLFTSSFPRKTDFVARYGGEEFAIILQEDGKDVAFTLAQKLLEKVRTLPIMFEDKAIRITVSIGIAELNLGEEPVDWVKRADAALYEAKRSGRDRVLSA